jgi:hypothetical protein
MPEGRALNANFDPGNAGNHEKGGAKGRSHGKKINGDCGKHGHAARDCKAEWSNYAFRQGEKRVQDLTENLEH